MTKEEIEKLAAEAADLQSRFWTVMRKLELALGGIIIDEGADLQDMTVEDLLKIYGNDLHRRSS